jgi:hypothetical protein
MSNPSFNIDLIAVTLSSQYLQGERRIACLNLGG